MQGRNHEAIEIDKGEEKATGHRGEDGDTYQDAALVSFDDGSNRVMDQAILSFSDFVEKAFRHFVTNLETQPGSSQAKDKGDAPAPKGKIGFAQDK